MNLRQRLFPSFESNQWRPMAGVALSAALLAGIYGMIHDQVTYTISPAYFTRVKFVQFAAADFGFPERVWAAEVGFLSTWWVGLLAGWFVGRLVVPRWPADQMWRVASRAFAVMLGASMLAGGLAAFVKPSHYGAAEAWEATALSVGITADELPAFVRVAHIHQGGYAGAVAGLGIMLWKLSRRRIR